MAAAFPRGSDAGRSTGVRAPVCGTGVHVFHQVRIGVGLVGSAVGFLHAFDIHAGRHIVGEGVAGSIIFIYRSLHRPGEKRDSIKSNTWKTKGPIFAENRPRRKNFGELGLRFVVAATTRRKDSSEEAWIDGLSTVA